MRKNNGRFFKCTWRLPCRVYRNFSKSFHLCRYRLLAMGIDNGSCFRIAGTWILANVWLNVSLEDAVWQKRQLLKLEEIMAYYDSSRFFCLYCGEEGIPLPRKRGQQRKSFHRKKIYCIHCHNTVNHIECRSDEDVLNFKEDFKDGVYENEAKESLAFIRNTGEW